MPRFSSGPPSVRFGLGYEFICFTGNDANRVKELFGVVGILGHAAVGAIVGLIVGNAPGALLGGVIGFLYGLFYAGLNTVLAECDCGEGKAFCLAYQTFTSPLGRVPSYPFFVAAPGACKKVVPGC